MRVVIAGGHGQIALILEGLLADRGDSVAGLIRNPAQSADLEAVGAEPLVVDLESSSVEEVATHLRGADAAILRPGLLTNDLGSGRVTLAGTTGRGPIPREDVAAVLLSLLDAPGSGGRTLEVIAGDTPVADLVAAHAGSST